jgi:sigma-B regulation protein RsbU (phosphoserine phosphatase)
VKILIAEDDRTSHRVLQVVLEKAGYRVQGAWNGTEAWQSLQSSDRPRLAVLDWMMPELDGAELTRRVRANAQFANLYIILLTAKGALNDVVVGLEAGADDYITKPFDREELLARIRVGQRVVELQESLEQRISDLETALSQIKTLQGLIPMCASCKKVRDDQGYWQQVEDYLMEHSEAAFSHALCPDCLKKYYPEYEKIKAKKGTKGRTESSQTS